MSEKNRIGVFLCHCGGNISDYVDLDKIENFDELFRKTQSLINIGLIPDNTMTYKFLYFFEAPLAIVLRLYYLKAKESEGEMQTYCYNKLIQIYNKPQFKSLRIYYSTQAKNNPPTFVIFINNKDLIQDHYKRYLAKKLRENFGFKGTPIVVSYRQKGDK